MPLPQSVNEIVDLVGLPAAIALVNAYGGTTIKFPRQAGRGGKLERELIALLGTGAAHLLIRTYVGEAFTVARCCEHLREMRDRQLIEDFEAGLSGNALARRYSMTQRNVYNILKRPTPERKTVDADPKPSNVGFAEADNDRPQPAHKLKGR